MAKTFLIIKYGNQYVSGLNHETHKSSGDVTYLFSDSVHDATVWAYNYPEDIAHVVSVWAKVMAKHPLKPPHTCQIIKVAQTLTLVEPIITL